MADNPDSETIADRVSTRPDLTVQAVIRSVVIFGGFAPFYATSLIGLTGSKLAPSYYVMIMAALSFAALVWLRRRFMVA
jgi:hypothetical protein